MGDSLLILFHSAQIMQQSAEINLFFIHGKPRFQTKDPGDAGGAQKVIQVMSAVGAALLQLREALQATRK